MPVTPELRLLRYFLAVADELNFTRAAETLYLSQPSLSSAIRSLEGQLSSTLFDRDTHGVRLTAAGAALVPHARAALSAAERGARAAQLAAAGRPDIHRLIYTFPLEPVALDALDRLEANDSFPPVTARGAWAGELLRDLRERRADAGLVRFPDDQADLQVTRLRGDSICALVADTHALAAAPSVTFADLAREPILTWAPELGTNHYNQFVANAFRSHGAHYREHVVNRLDTAGWSPVVRQEAIGIIGSAERPPGATRRIPIKDAPRMPILACRYAGAPPDRDFPALCDALQAAIDARALTVRD